MADACSVCGAEIPPNPGTGRVGKWNVIKAGNEGWFFQKDGTTYCPQHVPGWVKEWRKSRDQD